MAEVHCQLHTVTDADVDVSRLSLGRFRPATDSDLLDQFFLILTTDRAHASTKGRLELCLRASLGGIPAVVFQTVLPHVGGREPGAAGRYTFRFQIPRPGVPLALIHSVSVSNRSDDAWGVVGAELYGWHVNTRGEPVGGLLGEGPRLRVVSQDTEVRFPEPSPELQFQAGWGAEPTSDTYCFQLYEAPRALS